MGKVRIFGWVMAALLALALTGCTASPSRPVSSGSRKIQVVTSISPLADLIRQVAGDRAEVTGLVPIGVDPHDFDPHPADVVRVTRADLFIANGLGYEAYLSRLVESAQNPRLKVVSLADGLAVLGTSEEESGMGNPHLWLSVKNAMLYVEKIQEALTAVDPAGASIYAANVEAYHKQLVELDGWVRQQIATVAAPHRVMVVLHDAWPYYCQEYGLTNQPLLENPEAEPSARQYAAMVDQIRQQHIPAIFGEAGFNPVLVMRLASDTGVHYVDNLLDDTLTQDAQGDSYVKMIRYDTEQIVQALR